jgi:electron transport complex protein RnfG
MSETVTSWKMINTLGLIAVISGVLIVTSYQLTLKPIQANKDLMVQAAALEVLPGSTHVKVVRLDGPDAGRLFFGYDDSHQVSGVAIEAQGQGFADIIKVIYGYSPKRQVMIGLKVLESKETPGLGDKIEKDAKFCANFTALDLSLNADSSGLLHSLQVTKSGKKTEAWQIDGITGATISSKAVGRLLQSNSSTMIPIIARMVEGYHGKD